MIFRGQPLIRLLPVIRLEQVLHDVIGGLLVHVQVRVGTGEQGIRIGDARHFVAGDRGVSEWIFTGTTAEGKRVEVNGCDVFTFKNGKIAVKSSYFKNRTA